MLRQILKIPCGGILHAALLMLGLLLSCAGISPERAAAAGAAHARGVALLRSGDRPGATGAFREAIALDPGHADALWNLGDLLAAADSPADSAEALRILHHVVELRPDFEPAHRVLGYIYLNLGMLAESMEHSTRALNLDPRDPDAHLNLGIACTLSAAPDLAMFHLERARQLRPTDDRAELYLGIVLANMGRHEEAETRFEAALHRNADNFEAHDRLGRALLRRASPDLSVARRHFAEAVRIRPDFAPAHGALADLAVHDRDWLAAVRHARRALELNPGAPDATAALGIALYHNGDYAAARAPLREAAAARPGNAALRIFLGNAYMRTGDVPAAIHEYRNALLLTPRDATLHRNLGQALKFAGHTLEARHHLKQACELGDSEACTAGP